MRPEEMRRLLKSNQKLLNYCIKRILSDEETAQVMRKIYKNLMKKEGNIGNSSNK